MNGESLRFSALRERRDSERGGVGAAARKEGRPVAYSCSWPAYTLGAYPQQYRLMAEHCNTWRNFDDAQPGW